VAASLVLGACAFEPGEYPEEGERPDTGSGGTGGTGTGGTGTGSGTVDPTARVCSFSDSTLRLCIEFGDSKFDPMVTDASPARLDAASVSVDPTNRDSGVAAVLYLGSKIEVPESPMLDINGPMTIEMWVWPAYLHPSANLLENAGQYRMQLAGDGRIGCQFGNSQVWSNDDDNAAPLEWTHVACVYDGTTLAVLIDGTRSTSAPGAASPSGGTTGTTLGGGSYPGGLDDIHVYARALTGDQICSHAGRTTCSDGG